MLLAAQDRAAARVVSSEPYQLRNPTVDLRNSLFDSFLEHRSRVLAAAGLLILVVVFLDWRYRDDAFISFAFLYVIPILLAAAFLNGWTILTLAFGCSFLRETFSAAPWAQGHLLRFFTSTVAFLFCGLLVRELARNRQLVIERGRQLEEQMFLRQEAEEQTRILIESSPAAIVTVDDKGNMRLANEAAHRLLGSDEPLQGDPIGKYLPSLAKIPQGDGRHTHFRTEMECTGQRRNGEMFLAHVWFATYQTRSGARMAAVLSDSSEQLRERETLGLDSLMKTSRVLVGAMLHEVRNLCAAAGVAHTNLARKPGLGGDEDFEALGSLIKGLGSLASSELRLASERKVSTVDLRTVLSELQIAMGLTLAEAGITVRWEMPAVLPLARADHQSLLQVFLNVIQNSVRAMEETARKELAVVVSVEEGKLTIRFRDTGCGVAEPNRLFRPFDPDAETTGLGLYVSRAIMRSLKGDLFYEPQETGSCFTVQMALVEEAVGDRQ